MIRAWKMELDWTYNEEGQRGALRYSKVDQKQHGGDWLRTTGEQLDGSHGQLSEL